jgi:cyclophilin family peptidyl-prolyl cis-trans isomerase
MKASEMLTISFRAMKRRSFLRASAVGLVITACGGAQSGGAKTGGPATSTPTPTPQPASKATVELTKGGSFTFTLRGDKAPQTVARFAGKARSGFYDNLTFHRVEDWVVQGGDPLGTGTGGGRVPSEYNDLPFIAGAVGIARGQDRTMNNDSQFFVVKTDSMHLNGDYTNFGLVTTGMDVVKGIKIGDRIKSIRIE